MRASRANTSASMTDPIADTTQPIRPNPPNSASDDGSRKTPEPIMLPITSATVIQKPMRRMGGEDTARDASTAGLVYALAHARLRKPLLGRAHGIRAPANVPEAQGRADGGRRGDRRWTDRLHGRVCAGGRRAG